MLLLLAMRSSSLCSRSLLLLLLFLQVTWGLEAARKNVLLLVADDFRPNLGLYDEANRPMFNSPHMLTPHLDRLADKSVVFDRAFCQTSLCGPSRASFLTGRRPETTGVHGNNQLFRETGGNFTTLPGYFKQHGYRTLSSGKVFHGYHNNSLHNDFPWSWSERPFQATDTDVKNMSFRLVPEDFPLKDTVNTANALDQLREVAPAALLGQQNFFLALGIHRPHMPWDFPASFYDLYDKEDMELPYNKYAPTGMPDMAWGDFKNPREHYWDWNNDNLGVPDLGQINVTFPDWKIKQIRRAYYSSVSYMDAQMGRLLTELEDLGLASSTVVVFLGDHGFQLGEHAQYVKWNNFEVTNRVPLLVSLPGMEGPIHTEKLVELVDLYPTVAEAAGLPVLNLCPLDSGEVEVCTEGRSLMPLLEGQVQTWKTAVFYQRGYNMWNQWANSSMAYSVRTEDGWRYTEYRNMKKDDEDEEVPDWESEADHPELYHLASDPLETVNLWEHEEWTQVKEELSARLRLGWRGEEGI